MLPLCIRMVGAARSDVSARGKKRPGSASLTSDNVRYPGQDARRWLDYVGLTRAPVEDLDAQVVCCAQVCCRRNARVVKAPVVARRGGPGTAEFRQKKIGCR